MKIALPIRLRHIICKAPQTNKIQRFVIPQKFCKQMTVSGGLSSGFKRIVISIPTRQQNLPRNCFLCFLAAALVRSLSCRRTISLRIPDKNPRLRSWMMFAKDIWYISRYASALFYAGSSTKGINSSTVFVHYGPKIRIYYNRHGLFGEREPWNMAITWCNSNRL